MNINQEKLADLFKYHPPRDDEDRQGKHDTINEASIDYALTLSEVISNSAELTVILRAIQNVRMLANAALTYQSIGLSYKDVFEE